MAQLLYLIGLPGSGKSTYSQKYINLGYKIHSSDAIREELLAKRHPGETLSPDSEEGQTLSPVVFKIIDKRTINDLKNGFNVIYDACNTNSKFRKENLKKIKEALGDDVTITGIFFDKDIDICKKYCEQRNKTGSIVKDENGNERTVERNVPEEVLDRMHMQLLNNPPKLTDGFDKLEVIKDEKNIDIIK